MNQFMRAHGHLPGPTQRPVVAGVLTGIVAVGPALSLAWCSGALAATAGGIGLSGKLTASVVAALAAVAGALYGRVFMRAANDRRGGWLFGIGFGFLLWMLVPAALVFWARRAPLATGREGQALFAAHLVFGLVLGVAFPRVHTIVQRRSSWAG